MVNESEKKNRFGKILLRIGLGIFVLLFVIAISAELTSRPSFCPTCHYMEPFYESWKTSTHRDVTCVKCHFPPGLAGTVRGKLEGLVQVVNYFARSYVRRKPWAEISDESCLQSGCHETRLLKGRVIYKGVVFDHAPHLTEMRRGKKLRCTSCHSQIVQGEHITVTETTCFLCHFKRDGDVEFATYKKLSNCQTCHHWEYIPKAEMSKYRYDHSEVVKQKIECTRCHANVVVGDGFVPRENCYACHFDHARLSQYGNTSLLHQVHIAEHKVECIQCHLTIQHKVQKITADEQPECTTCHTKTHTEQLFLFTGRDFNGVKGTLNPMFEAGLNCASCHIFHKELMGQAEVRIAKPQSCETCHGRGYAHLLKLWEESAGKKLTELRNSIERVRSEINGKSVPKNVLELIKKADYGAHLVEVGKAIHNISYSDKIIEKSYEYLNQAIKIAKIDVELPKFAKANIPGECASCHTGIEGIVRIVYGLEFSHRKHLENGIKCFACHSNAKKHGEVIVSKEGCNACHHQKQTAQDCKACHSLIASIYFGNYGNSSSPDLMAQAGVECVDCHVVNNRVIKPDEKVCLNCHESGYDSMAKEWKADVGKLFGEVKSLMVSYKGKDKDEIANSIREIEKGGGGGLHNYSLIVDLLNTLKKKLTSSPASD